MIRVRRGKGAKDRVTLLAARAVAAIQTYRAAYAADEWLFPGSAEGPAPHDPFGAAGGRRAARAARTALESIRSPLDKPEVGGHAACRTRTRAYTLPWESHRGTPDSAHVVAKPPAYVAIATLCGGKRQLSARAAMRGT